MPETGRQSRGGDRAGVGCAHRRSAVGRLDRAAARAGDPSAASRRVRRADGSAARPGASGNASISAASRSLALAEQFVAALARLAAQVAMERRADWHGDGGAAGAVALAAAVSGEPGRGRQAPNATPPPNCAGSMRWRSCARRRPGCRRGRSSGRTCFARPQPAAPREGGYVALMEACLVVLRGRAGRPEDWRRSIGPPIPAVWRVPDALARIRAAARRSIRRAAILLAFLPPHRRRRRRSTGCRRAPRWRARSWQAWNSPATGQPLSPRTWRSDRST